LLGQSGLVRVHTEIKTLEGTPITGLALGVHRCGTGRFVTANRNDEAGGVARVLHRDSRRNRARVPVAVVKTLGDIHVKADSVSTLVVAPGASRTGTIRRGRIFLEAVPIVGWHGVIAWGGIVVCGGVIVHAVIVRDVIVESIVVAH